VLVEVGDTWIVVGLVPGQIRTLHTLPKGELKRRGWR
jgi:flagellar protein FliO/FliZ